MSASFDPYHKWLGIAPEEQPPHDYRLLGLRPFESDPDVIANAADRQTLLLRTLQAGKHQLECQRLLNEVSAARVRLLDLQKKRTYDEQLRTKLAAPAPPRASVAMASLPVAQPLTAADFETDFAAMTEEGLHENLVDNTPAAELPAPDPSRTSSVRLRRKKSWAPLAITVVLGIAAVAATGTYFAFFAPSESEPSAPVAQADEHTESAGDTAAPASEQSSAELVEVPEGNASAHLESVSGGAATNIEPVPQSAGESSTQTDVPQPSVPSASETTSSHPPQEAPPTEPSEPRGKKLPPDDNDLEAARSQVREIFPKEFEEAQSPEQRVALARFLISQAKQVKDDPLARYALLYESIEQSVEAGYYPTAQECVAALEPDWEIDRLRILGRALVAAARSPHAAAMREDLANAALGLADEAIEARRYDGADQIAGIADGLAARARDPDLRRKTRAVMNRTMRLKRDWEKVLVAQKTLETEPDDAAANLLVGKYLCLESGDVAEGLAHLAKGDHPELQKLAQRDLDEQERPADQRAEEKIALADDWSALAQLDEELTGFHVRAHFWYEQAATFATGLLKTKAERRRDELAANFEVQRLRAADVAIAPSRVAGPVDVQLKPLGTLLGHSDVVTRVAFSPKGALLATAGNDNKAKIWDFQKQKLLFTLPHNHNVQTLAWSSDGKLLATGSRDKTIQIWDATKGRVARAIAAHPGPQGVGDVAFAPGGLLLASCGADEPVVRLWNLKTSAAAGELRGPYRRVNTVQFTPGGQVVIGGADEDSATVWNSSGEVVHTFADTYSVQCMAVSPDGERLVTGGIRPRIWSLVDGQTVANLTSAFASCVAWSPDGALLAVCGTDGAVSVYDTFDWSLRQRASASPNQIDWVSFSADGKALAGCGSDAVVRLWELSVTPRAAGATPPPLASTPAPGVPAPASSSTNVPSASPVPGNSVSGPVRLLATLRPHAPADPDTNPGLAAALSPDGLWLATGGADRAIQLLDVTKGALARTFAAHQGPVTALGLDSQGEMLVSADDQGHVRLTNFPDCSNSRLLRVESPVARVIVLPGGSLIIGGRDGKLQQWSAQSLSKTFDYQGHSDAISGLAITADGARLISTSRDGKLISWSLTDRTTPGQVLRTEPLPIDDLAFSPQGESAALIVSRASRVIIYNLTTRKSLNIDSTGGQITAAAFLPNGRTLALGASSGEIQLFDPQQGQRPLTRAHAGAVHRLLLSTDGLRLASISNAGEVKVWELPAAGE
jgi:WD40 repeat protein